MRYIQEYSFNLKMTCIRWIEHSLHLSAHCFVSKLNHKLVEDGTEFDTSFKDRDFDASINELQDSALEAENLEEDFKAGDVLGKVLAFVAQVCLIRKDI